MNALKNKVQLIGNLGQIPEVKTFDGGKKMARISLVTNERYKNASGELVNEATWHTLIALRKNKFAFVEVCELMLRHYKADAARIRPTDRMVAHTGFLIFGRRIEPNTDPRGKELEEEIGMEE